MSGESSNYSKIPEFVNFSLAFPRFSKILSDVLNSPPKSRNHVAKPEQRSTPPQGLLGFQNAA